MKVNTRGIITIVALALCLGACSNNDQTGNGGRPTITWTTPPKATYQVPQGACLAPYNVPLVVTTDTAAEAAYINKIDACTTEAQNSTYLKNNSDAVWVLSATGSVVGTVTSWGDDAAKSSFRGVFKAGQRFLLPGSAVTVNLPPSSVVWDLDLPLTVGWVGQGVVASRITALFQTAWTDAIKNNSRAGAALVECTAAVAKYAASVNGLAKQQLSNIVVDALVMDALGTGKAVNNCRRQLMKVVVKPAGSERAILLSDDIAHVSKQTRYLDEIESSLKFAKQGSRYFELAIRFVSHL